VVSNAQVWALVGALGAFATATMTMVVFSYQSLRGFMEAKFDAVDSRFNGVDRRLDSLDRDVQALTDRVVRDRP
jgi:hypothetical protein